MRLFARLARLYPEASRRSLKRWFETGRVEVNGRVCRDGRVTPGAEDVIALQPRGRVPLPPALRSVHEDEDLLVIDKPPGLLTIATEHERERTAYRLLWDYLAGQTPPTRPFIVHRLDRQTSGLLVFAKSPAAKRALQEQFAARSVERVYVALVRGRVRKDHGTLVSRLGQDRGLRVRATRTGRQAVTHYRVLERRPDRTLLELRLGTGRRHQIRVQLADAGHPIIGDTAHGGGRGAARRLCLHATRLGFVHPRARTAVSFESAPPGNWV